MAGRVRSGSSKQRSLTLRKGTSLTVPNDGQLERAIAACYSTWAENYYHRYYGEAAPYPPVHADVIRDILLADRVTTVLDAGCGPASFLRHIANTSLHWHGFDLTPEMVKEARNVVEELGRSSSEVWIGSVLNSDAFRSPSGVAFDGAVMVGVLPHIPAECDEDVLERLHNAVVPGGSLIVEARNALFAMFSLNRATFELFTERLVDWALLESSAKSEEAAILRGLREALAARFRMDLPPVRPGYGGQKGYDEVLSRTHVPFELAESAKRAGWRDVSIHFTHYHALPPMFESLVPVVFRSASIELEDPTDWRGTLMASNFIIKGRRSL